VLGEEEAAEEGVACRAASRASAMAVAMRAEPPKQASPARQAAEVLAMGSWREWKSLRWTSETWVAGWAEARNAGAYRTGAASSAESDRRLIMTVPFCASCAGLATGRA
jgi:hypothetical protein